METHSNRRRILIVIIAIAIVLVVGVISFLILENVKKSSDKTTSDTKTTETTKSVTSSLDPGFKSKTFTVDTVTFTAPDVWTESTTAGANKSQSLLASTTYIPGEKQRTIHGDGTEYFTISVSVFSNSKGLSPKEWLEDDANSTVGPLANNDTESTADIHGYPAYYRHVENKSYQEVHYVLSSNNKIVYIHARTFEISADLPGVGDFRVFEPGISALAQSVTIK